MSTVTNLVDEIRVNVNEPSTSPELFFQDTEIINYIKRSINDICIDTDTNYQVYSMQIVGSSVGTVSSMNASATVNITLNSHGLETSQTVYFSNITGTISSALEGKYFLVTKLDANTFTIDADGSSYTWTSGGDILLMNQNITLASIGGSLVDLKFLSYRSTDWQYDIFDDLPKTSPKDTRNYTNPTLRRYTCELYNDTVHMNKAPKIGDFIVVGGRWLPTAISSGGSTYPLGAVQEDATIKYATAMCWYKKNKIETGNTWMSLYIERKNDIKEKTNKMVRSNYPSGMALRKTPDTLVDQNYMSNWSIPT